MIDKWRVKIGLPEKNLKYYKDEMISRIQQNFILDREATRDIMFFHIRYAYEILIHIVNLFFEYIYVNLMNGKVYVSIMNSENVRWYIRKLN